MSFNDISYRGLWWSLCLWALSICAVLVEGIMRNNTVKIYEFGLAVLEELSFKAFFLSSLLCSVK